MRKDWEPIYLSPREQEKMEENGWEYFAKLNYHKSDKEFYEELKKDYKKVKLYEQPNGYVRGFYETCAMCKEIIETENNL